jgi:hypothetical protein
MRGNQSSTEAQNGAPAVTSDSAGYSYVSWTEYPLDGSLGEQDFDSEGNPASAAKRLESGS